MSSAVKQNKTRFYFIDGLRGIAATWVVLFHFHASGYLTNLEKTIPPPITNVIFKSGDLGVPIFFCLSGFFIAYSLRNAQVSWSLFQKFSFRRWMRLSPPYYFSIAFVFVYDIFSAKITSEPLSFPSLGNVLAHIFYVQNLLDLKPIEVVYWTLCLEMQFYIVFFILLGLSQWIDRRLDVSYGRYLAFVPSLAVGALWPFEILTENLWPGLCLPQWHGFALGIFAYWAWQQTGYYRHIFFGYAGLVIIPALVRVVSVSDGIPKPKFTVAYVIVSLLLFTVTKANLMQSLLKWQWLQFLGLVSYSLYLLHNPIGSATFFISNKLFGQTLTTEILTLGIAFGLCVLCATIVYWLVEKPSILLSKKLKKLPVKAV